MQTRATDTTTFERTYPGTADQIRHVRADLAADLNECPRGEELLLAVSELSTNAVIHSRSRDRGGQVTVRVDIQIDDYVRAEVEDQGGPWSDPAPDDRPHGLDIVAALAGDGNWGIDGGQTGRVAWVRLDWKDEQ